MPELKLQRAPVPQRQRRALERPIAQPTATQLPDAGADRPWLALADTLKSFNAAVGRVQQVHEGEYKYLEAETMFDAKTHADELAVLHPHDPGVFGEKWTAYSDGVLADVHPRYRDRIASSLRRQGEREAVPIMGRAVAREDAVRAEGQSQLLTIQTDAAVLAGRHGNEQAAIEAWQVLSETLSESDLPPADQLKYARAAYDSFQVQVVIGQFEREEIELQDFVLTGQSELGLDGYNKALKHLTAIQRGRNDAAEEAEKAEAETLKNDQQNQVNAMRDYIEGGGEISEIEVELMISDGRLSRAGGQELGKLLSSDPAVADDSDLRYEIKVGIGNGNDMIDYIRANRGSFTAATYRDLLDRNADMVTGNEGPAAESLGWMLAQLRTKGLFDLDQGGQAGLLATAEREYNRRVVRGDEEPEAVAKEIVGRRPTEFSGTSAKLKPRFMVMDGEDMDYIKTMDEATKKHHEGVLSYDEYSRELDNIVVWEQEK